MTAHLLVAAAAAIITALVTPLVARLATRLGAIDVPADPRKVHREPVPTLGGLAMLLGFVAAMGVASLLGDFAPLFTTTSEPFALAVGVGLIVIVGVADDLIGLPPPIKLAGQIVASLGVVVFGIQLVHVWVPGLQIVALSPDLGLPLTIIALVAMINAVNLADGLDGLAAGVTGIAAVAFFLFVSADRVGGLTETVPSSATLLAAIVAGMAAGFLVHNWHPASIFMGDTGSMLLGLLLGSAGVAYVGRTTSPADVDFIGAVPLLLPVLLLAIPFVDSALAVVRRTVRRQPISVGDKEHLHHLLLAFGHSHRRAVLVLYVWSCLVALLAVGPAYLPWATLLPWQVLGTVVGIVLTLLGTRQRQTTELAEHPAQTQRRAG